jgi:hypothetical protein
VSTPVPRKPPERGAATGRFCPNCGSEDLILIEQVKTVSIYRCNACNRTVAIPGPKKP